jgi:hypothetical protein
VATKDRRSGAVRGFIRSRQSMRAASRWRPGTVSARGYPGVVGRGAAPRLPDSAFHSRSGSRSPTARSAGRAAPGLGTANSSQLRRATPRRSFVGRTLTSRVSLKVASHGRGSGGDRDGAAERFATSPRWASLPPRSTYRWRERGGTRRPRITGRSSPGRFGANSPTRWVRVYSAAAGEFSSELVGRTGRTRSDRLNSPG